MKRYALITGASAGIGKEFAYQLAQKDWNLILIARREKILKKISTKLSGIFAIDVQYIVADLTDTVQPQLIFDYCQSNKLDIAMLVNNAGYGVPGDFEKSSWQTHSDSLQLMLNSVVQLCHLFYPGMCQAGYGRIINVASLAGFAPPTAGHTLYGATKSFLIRFSHSLHLEAKDKGIHVTALCPGFTYTEFHDVNGTRSMVAKLPKFMWMQCEDVVEQGINAVEKNQPIKVNGKINRIIAAISSALPDRITRAMFAGKTNKYRKR
ncbi:3-oxoacyl-[acyl-carrier protein] reductase [hydrothermal vent metagenome]|uniref:3-oxoacyl-[acyl-carrier protein] reductase n=1 Tax=hydrothermal vent metagenome TaxID=652676 RepID=A0A3B0UT48_9ZZZZ